MEFVEINNGSAVYMTVPELGVPNAFTTRMGGVDTGAYATLNMGIYNTSDPELVRENYRRLFSQLGLDTDRMTRLFQTHSALVLPAGEEDICPPEGPCRHADGLVTDEENLALVVFTADCVPVLLHDPVRRAVSAIHAGWRGTVDKIVSAGVAKMEEQYGSRPENILAAIGPSIGGCCFEAGPEVREAALAALEGRGDGIIQNIPFPAKRPGEGTLIPGSGRDDRCYIDLKALNKELLLRAGLKEENIAVSPECTRCRPDRYWSHRYHRQARGSQCAVIALR